MASKYQEFLARSGEERIELIGGEIIPLAQPSRPHSRIQSALSSLLGPPFQFGDGGPGGWEFFTELDVKLTEGIIVRPDVCGIRIERGIDSSLSDLLEAVPDWICEVLSPSNIKHDTLRKRKLYAQFKVPYYWLIDTRPESPILEALTLQDSGSWGPSLFFSQEDERAKVPPFEAIELNISKVFPKKRSE